MRTILALLSLMIASLAQVQAFPTFDSDKVADQWLRESSPYYRMMASSIDARSGYTIRNSERPSGGLVIWESGKLFIELSNSLSGAERISILIFELTNAFQDAQHREIDQGAAAGRITSAREFGILHELIELDGLRHHRVVLEELDGRIGGVPAEMLRWINPALNKLSDYHLPFAHDYIKAQEAGGHTAHYHQWFPRQAPPAAR